MKKNTAEQAAKAQIENDKTDKMTHSFNIEIFDMVETEKTEEAMNRALNQAKEILYEREEIDTFVPNICFHNF